MGEAGLPSLERGEAEKRQHHSHQSSEKAGQRTWPNVLILHMEKLRPRKGQRPRERSVAGGQSVGGSSETSVGFGVTFNRSSRKRTGLWEVERSILSPPAPAL